GSRPRSGPRAGPERPAPGRPAPGRAEGSASSSASRHSVASRIRYQEPGCRSDAFRPFSRTMTRARDDAPPASSLIAAFAAIYFIGESPSLVIGVAIETIPPLLMAGMRFSSAGAILYLWARATGSAPPARKDWPAPILIGGLLFLVGNGSVTWSEKR